MDNKQGGIIFKFYRGDLFSARMINVYIIIIFQEEVA